MKFNKSNAYTDFDYETAEEMPDALPLNIISGGCHLYGYLLKPGAQYEGPHPAVVMFHGFPGYTTNNDLEYALMRMGCVVIHVNHRGAWGSEGNYLFSNLVDDAVAITKWAHNPATTDQYNIDPDAIFLVGHSMGGMTVLNAAGKLGFIRGVAAIAPYDLRAAFQNDIRKRSIRKCTLSERRICCHQYLRSFERPECTFCGSGERYGSTAGYYDPATL